jgi:hypothetical protein
MAAALLYAERLPTTPWDQLLAIGVVVTAALVPIAVKIGSGIQEKRTDRLRAEFGPEYERLVQFHGDWRKAEAELARRSRDHRRGRGQESEHGSAHR